MGTLRFDGVWFMIYSLDHLPPHAHGAYGEVRVVVEFDFAARTVFQSKRRNAVQPANANGADVRHILKTAAKYYDELKLMWEQTHG